MSKYPSLYAGQRATADLLDSMLPLQATKSADTSRASTTTLTADPDLQLAVAANAVYTVIGYIVYSQNATASSTTGITIGWSGPTSATLQWTSGGTSGPTATTTQDVVSNSISGTRSLPSNLGTSMVAMPFGKLVTSSTAGTLAMTWAQVASNATATLMRAGSWLELRRVS